MDHEKIRNTLLFGASLGGDEEPRGSEVAGLSL